MLHNELANNPEFFIDVLKCAYKPDSDEIIEEERKELTEEQIQNRAMQAYQLLHSWDKIPGVDEAYNIDNDFLTTWVQKVRALAIQCGRIEVADMQIGQVLAQYPETIDSWPPDEICNVIETINTDSIKRNFSSATFNKRGSSSRGPFDGGDIERSHAKGYEEDAKRMDERAERDRLED